MESDSLSGKNHKLTFARATRGILLPLLSGLATPCMAHDSGQLILAGTIVLLLPLPALWLMLRGRWFLLALLAMWLGAFGLLFVESSVIEATGQSLPSGLLSVVFLALP